MAQQGFSHNSKHQLDSSFTSKPGAKLGESASHQSGLEATGAMHALPSPKQEATQTLPECFGSGISCLGDYASGSEKCDWCEWQDDCRRGLDPCDYCDFYSKCKGNEDEIE